MLSGQTSLRTGQTGRHITRQQDQRYGNRQVGGATVCGEMLGLFGLF